MDSSKGHICVYMYRKWWWVVGVEGGVGGGGDFIRYNTVIYKRDVHLNDKLVGHYNSIKHKEILFYCVLPYRLTSYSL